MERDAGINFVEAMTILDANLPASSSPDIAQENTDMGPTTGEDDSAMIATQLITPTEEQQHDEDDSAMIATPPITHTEEQQHLKEKLVKLFQQLFADPNNSTVQKDIISRSLILYLNWIDSGQPADAAKSLICEIFSTVNLHDSNATTTNGLTLSPLQQAILEGLNHYDFLYIDGYRDQPELELTDAQAEILKFEILNINGDVELERLTAYNFATQMLFAETFKKIIILTEGILEQQAKNRAQDEENRALLIQMQHIREACVRLLKLTADNKNQQEQFEDELAVELEKFFDYAKTSTVIGDDDLKTHEFVYEPLVGAQCEVLHLPEYAAERELFAMEFTEDTRELIRDWVQLVEFNQPESTIRKNIFAEFKARMGDNPRTKIAADQLWATLKDHGLAHIAACQRQAAAAPPQGILYLQQRAAETAGAERRESATSQDDDELLKIKANHKRTFSTLSISNT